LWPGLNPSLLLQFDIRLSGNGRTRQDPLHFTILGLGIDDIDNYFAARVAGFDYSGSVSSAFFYGDKVSQVPVPAAAWLFGTGLLGLAGVARRKKN